MLGLDVCFLAMCGATLEGIEVKNLVPFGQHGNEDPVVPIYKSRRYDRGYMKTKDFIL